MSQPSDQQPPPAPSSKSAPIDLELVRRLFRSPANVAESGFLRREVSGRMFERLELVKLAPSRVLDAGCGEGADLSVLQQRFSAAHVLGLDGAAAMLEAARGHQAAARSSLDRLLSRWLRQIGRTASPKVAADLVCSDFARLPLAAASVDLVWSNLALHWHPQPDLAIREWRRVLAANGLLMFSCFGPDTFKELRSAFAGLDDAQHVLPFVDMHDYGDLLIEAGFSTPVMDMETITVTYSDAGRLLADLRAWGGNPLETRRRGLFGRQVRDRLLRNLAAMRQPDGKIPLTFEVIYGHAFRPVAHKTASGESIVRMDLRKK